MEKTKAKTGGRKAGTPNKSTLSLFAKCEALNIDPFNDLLELAADRSLEDPIRLKALTEVCGYLYPKRKAVEVTNIDPKLQEAAENLNLMTDEEKIKLLEDQLKELKNGS